MVKYSFLNLNVIRVFKPCTELLVLLIKISYSADSQSIKNINSNGSYNISSPNPITNKYFMSVLRKKLHRSFGIPSQKWLLEIGARIIKTETELILKSRFVIPERLLNKGFQFTYPTIEEAIEEIIA